MTSRHRRLLAAEDGVVAGGEALLVGVLVFVTGTLLLVSMWTVVDAKIAVEAAAREATRAVVEAPAAVLAAGATGDETALGLARTAALAAVTAQRGAPDSSVGSWSLDTVTVSGRYERCGTIQSTVRVTIDTPRLPFVGRRLTAGVIEGTHLERIEPYRAGLPVPPGGVSC